MLVNDISSTPFCCFLNNNVYKLNWLQKVNFNTQKPVDIGIDQSSTSTGICIQNEDILFFTELPRGVMNIAEYKTALKKEFNCLFSQLSIKHFIYEKHKHISTVHSVINEITATLKTYTKSMDKNAVKIVGISPPVWRKGFFSNKEDVNGFTRDKVKISCVEEVIKEKPLTEKFRNFSQKDYDAFEAYGIINGYLKLNYAADGTRIVNTSMSYNAGRNFNYLLFKCANYEKDSTIDYIKKTYASSATPIILANSELLLEDSLNRIVGEYEEAILVNEGHSEFPAFIIETGEVYNKGEMFLIYVRKERP